MTDTDNNNDSDENQRATSEQHTFQNVDNIATDNSPRHNFNDDITPRQSDDDADLLVGHSMGGAHGFRQMSGSVSPRSDDGDDEESPVRHKPTRLSHSKRNIDNMLKELSLTSPEAIETGPLSQQRLRQQRFDSSSPRSLDYSTSNNKEQVNHMVNQHRRRSSDGSVNVLSHTSPETVETGLSLQQRLRQQRFDSLSPRGLDYSTDRYREQLNDRVNQHRQRSSDGSVNVPQLKKEVSVAHKI